MNHALTALFDPSQLSTIITVQKVVGVLVACWAAVSLAAALADEADHRHVRRRVAGKHR